ncbi:MAG: hypothetical protein IIA33_03690, partial [Planctomycetes bacterium]|nr:hypothetical protein [Planctomycetota bacterium]
MPTAAAALRGISNSIAENPVGTAISTLALSRMLESYPERLAEATPAATGTKPDAVTIRTSSQSVSVAPGSPATLEITLQIADGYHINANPASLDYLIATAVVFDGVSPTRIAYPEASRFKPAFAAEALDWGIANRLCKPEALLGEALAGRVMIDAQDASLKLGNVGLVQLGQRDDPV